MAILKNVCGQHRRHTLIVCCRATIFYDCGGEATLLQYAEDRCGRTDRGLRGERECGFVRVVCVSESGSITTMNHFNKFI